MKRQTSGETAAQAEGIVFGVGISVLVLGPEPGTCTAIVSGVSNTTGVPIVEVFELE